MCIEVIFVQKIKNLNFSLSSWLAATQFQESDARHGFPCYDEPAIRSIFSIRITHARSYHALCNMPVKEMIPT
jgi:aminopeptidase N